MSATPATPETTEKAAARRTRKTGKVTSNKMEKTVAVEVIRIVKHGRYGRYVRRSKTFLADDRVFKCQPGDVVEIEETRPLSARKRWRVKAVITRSGRTGPAVADLKAADVESA
jgi:small subunit ribosomal protein S17